MMLRTLIWWFLGVFIGETNDDDEVTENKIGKIHVS